MFFSFVALDYDLNRSFASYNFFRHQDNNVMVNLAVALKNEGISAFRFDFAGNG